MKNKIIAGNWKMNKTSAETAEFVKKLIPLVKGAVNTVILCVPFTDIKTAVELSKNTNIFIGAQNVHWAQNGAFTGEISAGMLTELGVKYVVTGHSERRQYFNETDETVNKRTLAALNSGITPIVCIGETLTEREGGLTEAVLERQLREGFKSFSAEQFGKVILAYEPVWAIGTGKTATAKDADETIGFIRKVITEIFSLRAGEEVYIQYGGSMNEKNGAELLSMPNIDGGLIGGASLDAEKFAVIVRANEK